VNSQFEVLPIWGRKATTFRRVELAKQTGITWVGQIRFLTRWAIEYLRQHVGQCALKD
jgi:hypothetical protein